jgi:DNA-binding response OmpR family regulator
MRNPKRVYTREQVLEAIGGSAEYSSDHLLDTHASRLRLKIKSAGGPRVISAIRGVGYRLMSGSSAQ